MTEEMVTIPLEVLRHLYDLAVDTPLLCSGSFDSDDVAVLRATAERIHVDPLGATPAEFVRDFRHPFKAPALDDLDRERVTEFHPNTGDGTIWATRSETDEEVLARFGGALPDECQAGSYNRRCGRPKDHEMHGEWTK